MQVVVADPAGQPIVADFDEPLNPATVTVSLPDGKQDAGWTASQFGTSGEVTFKIGDEVTVGGPGTCAFMPRGVQHAWKNSGAETARALFLYTPAGAGGLLEEQQRTQGTTASMNEREKAEQRQRYGWEIVGPNPL